MQWGILLLARLLRVILLLGRLLKYKYSRWLRYHRGRYLSLYGYRGSVYRYKGIGGQ